VRIRLVDGLSLNDRCFLLIDLPARYEKLSLCDLFGFRLERNMILVCERCGRLGLYTRARKAGTAKSLAKVSAGDRQYLYLSDRPTQAAKGPPKRGPSQPKSSHPGARLLLRPGHKRRKVNQPSCQMNERTRLGVHHCHLTRPTNEEGAPT
jgi:hypothetical protein